MANNATESLQEIAIDKHLLFSKKVSNKAPTVIVFGGIHGNEPAGILALQKVIQKIEQENLKFKGNFYAIAGNLNALKKGLRFEAVDLNRIWTHENLIELSNNGQDFSPEQKEQEKIYKIIQEIEHENNGPLYFIDLHTTSSVTIPFITISDSLNNRNFSNKFSVPIVLGIEEYLDGPLLTYINEFGYISLGFEAGQHNDTQSVLNFEAFVWQVLVASKCLDRKELEAFKYYQFVLDEYKEHKNFYEIDYRYYLKENASFKMLNGFENFQHVSRHEVLAHKGTKEIKSPLKGQIFMPLYQKQGKDGFFIVRRISQFWLILSIVARKLHLHNLLRILPGINQDKNNKYTLIVNPRVAKFLATEIFHLFGYRKKTKKGLKLHFIKRDRDYTRFKN